MPEQQAITFDPRRRNHALIVDTEFIGWCPKWSTILPKRIQKAVTSRYQPIEGETRPVVGVLWEMAFTDYCIDAKSGMTRKSEGNNARVRARHAF